MNKQPEQMPMWDECRPGEISAMVHRSKRRQRRQFALQLTAGAVVGLLFGAVYLGVESFRQPAGEKNFGGITCTKVREHAKTFVHRDDALSPETRRRIDAHLAKCPECRKLVRKMQNNRGAAEGAAVVRPVVISASLPHRAPALKP